MPNILGHVKCAFKMSVTIPEELPYSQQGDFERLEEKYNEFSHESLSTCVIYDPYYCKSLLGRELQRQVKSFSRKILSLYYA